MTLNDIIKMALAHLEYGTDEDAVSTFQERFTIYANDAVRIIADSLKMTATETVPVVDKSFSVFGLLHECTKIVSVAKNGAEVDFDNGSEFGQITLEEDGEYTVTYRYVPTPMYNLTDTPNIPPVFHPILYLYIVHCHHNSRSTSSDFDRMKWNQSFYEQMHRLVRRNYATPKTFKFSKLPWQTGEI